jgi:hypothetical protein
MATNTMTGSAGMTGTSGGAGGITAGGSDPQRHSEGVVARSIEQYTAQAPSDWFLWAAGASILASISLRVSGNRHDALFVGQWAPTFLILGLYNKIVKVAGSDRVHGPGM